MCNIYICCESMRPLQSIATNHFQPPIAYAYCLLPITSCCENMSTLQSIATNQFQPPIRKKIHKLHVKHRICIIFWNKYLVLKVWSLRKALQPITSNLPFILEPTYLQKEAKYPLHQKSAPINHDSCNMWCAPKIVTKYDICTKNWFRNTISVKDDIPKHRKRISYMLCTKNVSMYDIRQSVFILSWLSQLTHNAMLISWTFIFAPIRGQEFQELQLSLITPLAILNIIRGRCEGQNAGRLGLLTEF